MSSGSNSKSNYRILVVDDNPINLLVMTQYIRNLGYYEVDTSDSGADAIQRITEGNRYRLILMDMVMPEMSGAEAASIIQNAETEKGLPLTPVVAVTAEPTLAQNNDIFRDVLSKPVSLERLSNILEVMLEPTFPVYSSDEFSLEPLSKRQRTMNFNQ